MALVYPLSTYSLAAISNSVSSLSASPVYIWSTSIPAAAKGVNAMLFIFFNLYLASQFSANQSFDYGIYIDGVLQGYGDIKTTRYVQTAAGIYAMNYGGVSYGNTSISPLQPFTISLFISPTASQIQIGILNSSAILTTSTQVGVTATLYSI